MFQYIVAKVFKGRVMKYCVLFAGPVGCSKTPTAVYLSHKLNLPIFSNDAIRTEVIEDLGRLEEKEYIKRRDERLKQIARRGLSFILDASVDRRFQAVKEILEKRGYEYIIISFDLSKDFLVKLHKLKKYHRSVKKIDTLLKDHNDFLKKYEDKVGVKINDNNFANRLDLALVGVKKILK